MEKIDLSTKGRDINKAYEQVVKGEGVSSGSWVIFGPDSSKAYYPIESGVEIDDFLSSFDDSQIQFGFARVNPPGSDVFKNLLIGWCPDSAPLKSRSSFAQNFAEISKLLKGYHVQITARDEDDLDKAELLSRLSAAAGARYSIQALKGSRQLPTSTPVTTPNPTVIKPSYSIPKPTTNTTPARYGSEGMVKPAINQAAEIATEKQTYKFKDNKSENDDDWDEPAIEERDFSKSPLQPNVSTWKPIGRVNLQDVIREENSRKNASTEIADLKKKDKQKKEQELNDYLKLRPTSSLNTKGSDLKPFEVTSQDLQQTGLEKTVSQLKIVDAEDQHPRSPGFKNAFPADAAGFEEQVNVKIDAAGADIQDKTENAIDLKSEKVEYTDIEASTEEENMESLPYAIADYDHEAGEDNELSFNEGDKIVNIEFIDEDWWIGELEDSGERGLFPSNHVSLA